MAQFDPAITITLKNEGGYADVAGDTGGETYAGISRKDNPTWSGWSAVDAKPHPVKNNTMFSDLTPSVKTFYQGKYWKGMLGDSIKDQDTANIIFDAYVNSGSYIGWMTQIALGGSNVPITKSIPFNAATVAKINAQDPSKFFNAFKNARASYYNSIAKGSNSKFLSGWLKRLDGFSYSGAITAIKNNPVLSIAIVIAAGVGLFIAYRLLYLGKTSLIG